MNDHCHLAIRHAFCVALGLLAACAVEPPGLTSGLDPGTSARASLGDADLVARAVIGPRSATPLAWLEVTAEVCNQGGLVAPYSDVRVVLSADDTIDALDIELSTHPVSYLEPGACALVNAWGSAPDLPGRYRLGAIADVHDLVPEADETNNAGAGSALAVGHDPDLIVDRVRAPATASPSGDVEVEVRVCNHGQSTSADTSVMVELTAAGDHGPLPGLLASVSYLEPGDCFNATLPAAFSLPASLYAIGATVDPWDQVVEIDEDNNTFAGGRLGVGYGPDLIVTGIEAPNSTAPGLDTSVTVTACNQGPGPAFDSHVTVFLSEDDAFDPASDMPIGHAQAQGLEPAQCAPLRASLYSLPDGAFRLIAVIDPFQGVPEIFEDNNVLVGDSIGAGFQPDLVITEVTRERNPWYADPVEVRVRVCNLGPQHSSAAGIDLRLSLDDQIAASDPLVGMASVPDLAPGACMRVPAVTFELPFQGVYVLGAIVDPADHLDELIETNNGKAGPRVGAGAGADLVVTAVSAPALAYTWSTLSVFVQVCNDGRDHSAGAEVALYASRNDDISRDDELAGIGYVGGIAPGACTGVFVPSVLDTPPGTYLLGALVDAGEDVDESVEDNNAGFSAPLATGDAPDLAVTGMSAPASVEPGAPFEIAATVCNQGFAPSAGAPLEVLASNDPHVSRAGDWIVGFAFVGPLQPGQCYTASIPVTAYGYANAQWFAALVDFYDSVDEIREDNNSHPARAIGVGPGADLVVPALSPPATVQPYESYEATARVCNQGQDPSPAAGMAVFVGEGALTPSLPPSGWGLVPGLEPGACADVAVTVHSMGHLGEQEMVAIVDPSGGEVYELDEDNNTSPVVRIGIGYEADLIVSRVRGPASAQPGVMFDVTVRVCNQGEADSVGAHLDVVLSHDARIDGMDHALATIPVPFLAQGACQSVTTPVQVSAFAGVYTLGAVVRPGFGPPELVSSNNAAAAGPLAVGWDADLVVSAVTGPATAATGSALAIQVKVCNRGQSPSQPTDVWAVLSRDAFVDMGDIDGAPAAIAPLGSVAPGACAVVSVPAFAHHPEGTYVLGALVDPWSSVYELVESNNTGAGTTIEIVPL
jgi:subtilase family serine protease